MSPRQKERERERNQQAAAATRASQPRGKARNRGKASGGGGHAAAAQGARASRFVAPGKGKGTEAAEASTRGSSVGSLGREGREGQAGTLAAEGLGGAMGRDELLRRSLVALAAVVVVTGLATASLRKAAATYGFGILAIAGVLLPDWEFFDRDFSQWLTPMPASRRTAAAAAAEREHDVWK